MIKRGFRRWAAFSSIFPVLGALAVTLLGAPSCSTTVSFGGGCGNLDSCDGACIDLLSDPDNCGACGNACPPGESCEAGGCGCPAGLVACGNACVDVTTNPVHCGGCSIACPPATVCTGGVCAGACTGGLADCGGACVDLSSDPLHCGACNAVCPPGTSCVSGACQGSCPPGLDLCAGLCVDLATDPTNCGGCGIACGPGEPCQGGACMQCTGTSACGICDVQPIGPMVPATASGSTLGAPDHFDPTCGPGGSGERAYTFTAPASGTYVFDTQMSAYDTVLALLDPASCMEILCNDDTAGQLSQITANLSANQSVLVVVDGWNGSEGPYTLNVSTAVPGTCPDGDLGMTVPQTVTGSTMAAGDDVVAPCGGTTLGQDRAFVFTAPMAGTYVFDTFGSSFDTVLYVLDGDCLGLSLACNDDTPPGLQSTVSVSLATGQTVVVVVDGWGNAQGSFVLHIDVM